MFYAIKFHPEESYIVVEGEKVPSTVKAISKLYDLPNGSYAYPDQRIIDNPMRSDVKKII